MLNIGKHYRFKPIHKGLSDRFVDGWASLILHQLFFRLTFQSILQIETFTNPSRFSMSLPVQSLSYTNVCRFIHPVTHARNHQQSPVTFFTVTSFNHCIAGSVTSRNSFKSFPSTLIFPSNVYRYQIKTKHDYFQVNVPREQSFTIVSRYNSEAEADGLMLLKQYGNTAWVSEREVRVPRTWSVIRNWNIFLCKPRPHTANMPYLTSTEPKFHPSEGRCLNSAAHLRVKLQMDKCRCQLKTHWSYSGSYWRHFGSISGPMATGRFTQYSNGHALHFLPNFPIKLSSTPVHTILFFFIMFCSFTSQSMSIACSRIVINTFKLPQYCGSGHLVTAHDDRYCSGNVRHKEHHVT